MTMKKNIGSTDKMIRYVAAVVIFALYFVLPENLQWLSLIGIIPLATALFGFCPLYPIMKINTDKK
jgi:hypothetical protein